MEKEELKNEKTYDIEVICTNCHYDGVISVPFGLLVQMGLSGKKCPYCGCAELSSKGKPKKVAYL